MIELFQKRGRWCGRTADDRLFKFNTEQEAAQFFGLTEVLGEVPSALEEEPIDAEEDHEEI